MMVMLQLFLQTHVVVASKEMSASVVTKSSRPKTVTYSVQNFLNTVDDPLASSLLTATFKGGSTNASSLIEPFNPSRTNHLNPKFYKFLPPSLLQTIPAAGALEQHSDPLCLFR